MASNGRVLLVDDEPLVLEIFEEALSQLEHSFFDVAVCDVMLEGMDGFDLLDRARRSNAHISFILVTGAPSHGGKSEADTLGVHYLTKPIDLNQLIATVKESLGRRTSFPQPLRQAS